MAKIIDVKSAIPEELRSGHKIRSKSVIAGSRLPRGVLRSVSRAQCDTECGCPGPIGSSLAFGLVFDCISPHFHTASPGFAPRATRRRPRRGLLKFGSLLRQSGLIRPDTAVALACEVGGSPSEPRSDDTWSPSCHPLDEFRGRRTPTCILCTRTSDLKLGASATSVAPRLGIPTQARFIPQIVCVLRNRSCLDAWKILLIEKYSENRDMICVCRTMGYFSLNKAPAHWLSNAGGVWCSNDWPLGREAGGAR